MSHYWNIYTKSSISY